MLVEIAEENKRQAIGKMAGNRDAWARSLGWSSWLERQDAIDRNEKRYADGLKWQSENLTILRAAKKRPWTNDGFNPTPEQMTASRRHLGLE